MASYWSDALTTLAEQLQQTLGAGFRVERELGGGGMSRVFVAREVGLDREIVVKVLPAEMLAAVSLARFQREVQLAARMQHPHIVPLLSAGETGGLPFFTMPFIEGESLRARLSRAGELPVADALRIMRDVSSALAYAHAHGVVHRDIKPENIMISGDSAVVTDFGVAKALADAAAEEGSVTVTSRGVALGTVGYMAPEQASADPAADHRADIYSLGVVGFEMLAGDPPFSRRTAEATIAAHMVEEAPPLAARRPAVPTPVAALIARCLAKRPADRPQSAKALIADLDSIQSGEIQLVPGRLKTRPFLFSPVAIAAIVVLLAVGAEGIWWRVRGTGGARATADRAGVRALAVLPFVNVGGNRQDEYFSDGMTDELSATLSKIPGLRVASRTSTYAVGSTEKADLAEIGRRLHVDAVLEGRLRREGNRLRLTAQLTNVGDGLAIWSESYEREVKDVFAVQDDISRSIADALRLAMMPAPRVTERAHGTTDVQAYDFFLRGQYFWYHRDLPRAIAALEQATARDPKFARAYATLASSYALTPEYSDSPPADATARTRAAAARALELDSTQADAHTALGLLFSREWKWQEAEASFRHALALEPNHATAHQWMGELLFQLGRMPESIAQMQKAAELDPLAPIPAVALCYSLYLDHQFAAAVSEGQRAVELAPKVGIAHATLAEAYLGAGDGARALAAAKEAYRLDPGLASRAGLLSYVAGFSGERATAERALHDLQRRSPAAKVPAGAIMIAFLGVGDRENALLALEKAVANHEIFLSAYPLKSEPMFDPIRGDPRFARALNALGLGVP
ncbi:MAG: protein kinase [Gemmatimonadota bacterium]|nr:protein kinase [Gemmatimonadota bacterium]